MRTRQQLVNTGIYVAFALGTSAVGFLAVLVLTRLLSTAEYGRIGLFFSALFFIAPLVSLAADGLVAVNKSALDADRYRAFQQTYVGLAMLCAAGCTAVMAALWLAGIYADALIVGTPLFALVRFFATMAGTEYVAEQRAIAYGVLTMATSGLAVLLTIAFVWAFGESGTWRVLAMFAADLLLLGVRYRGRLRIFLEPRLDREFARQIVHFGLPSVIAVAGGWGLNEADKVIVARNGGLSTAGVYTAAAALAAIMMTFNQSLVNALYPGLFRALSEGRRSASVLADYVVRFVTISAAFGAVAVGLYFAFADHLLPTRYLGGKSIFVALMAAGVATSLYRPFGLLADFYRLARTRALALLAGGASAIAIGYYGVRSGSLLWAPAGIACGYVIASAIIAVGLRVRDESLAGRRIGVIQAVPEETT